MKEKTTNNIRTTLAKTVALFTMLLVSSITFANDCAHDYWTDGQWYDVGDTVEFDGDIYVAVNDNPGYSPAGSPWFWDWKASAASSCSYHVRDLSSESSCVNNSWTDGQWYGVGDRVSYDGDIYVAKFGNPGYNPTISTYFWDWQSTNDTSCNSIPHDVDTGNNVGTGNDCGTQWHSANITTFSSYPDPNEFECPDAANCPWMGMFKAIDDRQSSSWVEQNNIIAVHSKDYEWLKGKTIKIKQGSREINATVYDECNDSDCNGCCSTNMGNKDTLIDLERYTMKRFGSHSGAVEWQICD
jgi:hypothetical protein